MTVVPDDAYWTGRQRIVQGHLFDHAIRPDDERSLCGRHTSRALVLHEVAFVPGAGQACEECSRLLSEA